MSYRTWQVIFTVFSFIVSNAGLSAIIKVSVPVLSALYPIAIVLVLLTLTHKSLGARFPRVYFWTVLLVGIASGALLYANGNLELAINTLFFNYSSGMVARIGFAIATITKPDILIADEVLSVGDFLFQQKCEKRMQELMAGGTTVILVSHSIEQIERMCSKVAWLSHGHLKMNGDTATVCAAYKATQRGEA